jgi:hypothetical protein
MMAGKKVGSTPRRLIPTTPRLKDPSSLPGSFASRVFVGGSYKAAATAAAGMTPRALLDKVKNAVVSEGLHPIVADEYEVANRDRDIHHDAIWLLSACRLAIFELTEFSGALMEIERTVDFGTRCIVLHHDPTQTGIRLSWMLSSFVFEFLRVRTRQSGAPIRIRKSRRGGQRGPKLAQRDVEGRSCR